VLRWVSLAAFFDSNGLYIDDVAIVLKYMLAMVAWQVAR
jgi:hypothetical protein